jgi:hypothetical protein
MPSNDAVARRNRNFDKDPNTIGRFAERLRPGQVRKGSTVRGGSQGFQTIPLSVRTGGRATLQERDNPAEFFEFHWDPTTYKIGKTAKWNADSVEGGTDIFSYSGCTPTVVSFELFLNDIGQPHKTQRTVENSLAWLMNRLRPRSEEAVTRRGITDPSRRQRWPNVRDPSAGKSPPILVLFGMRDQFECVLASVDIVTEFQAPPQTLESFGIHQSLADLLRAGQIPPEAAQAVDAALRTRDILRARASIVLKEYVNAPDEGGGSS